MKQCSILHEGHIVTQHVESIVDPPSGAILWCWTVQRTPKNFYSTHTRTPGGLCLSSLQSSSSNTVIAAECSFHENVPLPSPLPPFRPHVTNLAESEQGAGVNEIVLSMR